ncbi:MAG: nucleotide exchange factor GrpE, partial [Gaiellaceae bacterium]
MTEEPRVEEQEEIVEEPVADEPAPAPDESYLRLAADFDNYRKRVSREQVELTRRANEQLLHELL